jgi:hypothetical protein
MRNGIEIDMHRYLLILDIDRLCWSYFAACALAF